MSEEAKKKKAPAKKTTAKTVVEKKDDHSIVVKKVATKASAQYSKGVQYSAIGKRKNAGARVILRAGSGKYLVNDNFTLEQYFDHRKVLLTAIAKPFKVVGLEGQYDVFINVAGGGKSGQAGAVAHGITRAIIEIMPEVKKQLKIEGLVTRDSRVKETKKYGRKRARKGYTYRKR
jgi:small subunit ribosomal protein S9